MAANRSTYVATTGREMPGGHGEILVEEQADDFGQVPSAGYGFLCRGVDFRYGARGSEPFDPWSQFQHQRDASAAEGDRRAASLRSG